MLLINVYMSLPCYFPCFTAPTHPNSSAQVVESHKHTQEQPLHFHNCYDFNQHASTLMRKTKMEQCKVHGSVFFIKSWRKHQYRIRGLSHPEHISECNLKRLIFNTIVQWSRKTSTKIPENKKKNNPFKRYKSF